jgi:hypothetical protein
MRLGLTTVLCAFVAVCASSLASADTGSVQHQRYPFTSTFTDTSLCGFPIAITSSANYDDAMFFDSAGNLVRILETVNHGTLTYSAHGHTLSGIGTGGVELVFNTDGSVTVNTFGINIFITIPGQGTVILDAGHASYLFDPHLHVLFQAGPSNYDLTTFCNALS